MRPTTDGAGPSNAAAQKETPKQWESGKNEKRKKPHILAFGVFERNLRHFPCGGRCRQFKELGDVLVVI